MLMRKVMSYLSPAVIAAVLAVFAAEISAQVPAETEARLRAIYETREFRAKSFQGTWLSDSSGYTVTEPDPASDGRVRVRYDTATGKRTVLGEAQAREEGRRRGGRAGRGGQFRVGRDL